MKPSKILSKSESVALQLSPSFSNPPSNGDKQGKGKSFRTNNRALLLLRHPSGRGSHHLDSVRRSPKRLWRILQIVYNASLRLRRVGKNGVKLLPREKEDLMTVLTSALRFVADPLGATTFFQAHVPPSDGDRIPTRTEKLWMQLSVAAHISTASGFDLQTKNGIAFFLYRWAGIHALSSEAVGAILDRCKFQAGEVLSPRLLFHLARVAKIVHLYQRGSGDKVDTFEALSEYANRDWTSTDPFENATDTSKTGPCAKPDPKNNDATKNESCDVPLFRVPRGAVDSKVVNKVLRSFNLNINVDDVAATVPLETTQDSPSTTLSSKDQPRIVQKQALTRFLSLDDVEGDPILIRHRTQLMLPFVADEDTDTEDDKQTAMLALSTSSQDLLAPNSSIRKPRTIDPLAIAFHAKSKKAQRHLMPPPSHRVGGTADEDIQLLDENEKPSTDKKDPFAADAINGVPKMAKRRSSKILSTVLIENTPSKNLTTEPMIVSPSNQLGNESTIIIDSLEFDNSVLCQSPTANVTGLCAYISHEMGHISTPVLHDELRRAEVADTIRRSRSAHSASNQVATRSQTGSVADQESLFLGKYHVPPPVSPYAREIFPPLRDDTGAPRPYTVAEVVHVTDSRELAHEKNPRQWRSRTLHYALKTPLPQAAEPKVNHRESQTAAHITVPIAPVLRSIQRTRSPDALMVKSYVEALKTKHAAESRINEYVHQGDLSTRHEIEVEQRRKKYNMMVSLKRKAYEGDNDAKAFAKRKEIHSDNSKILGPSLLKFGAQELDEPFGYATADSTQFGMRPLRGSLLLRVRELRQREPLRPKGQEVALEVSHYYSIHNTPATHIPLSQPLLNGQVRPATAGSGAAQAWAARALKRLEVCPGPVRVGIADRPATALAKPILDLMRAPDLL